MTTSRDPERLIGAYLDEAEKYDIGVPTVRASYRIIKSLEFWLGLSGGVDVHPLPAPTAAAVGARPSDKH